MNSIALIYDSTHGHIRHIATHITAGARSIDGNTVRLLDADEASNRLGSWSGLKARTAHASPADRFVPGDIRTARMFGRNFARTLQRITCTARQGEQA